MRQVIKRVRFRHTSGRDISNFVLLVESHHTGFTSAELLRRFERESQALGRLQHPGIAQIYEAGAADTGFGPQPYLSMELIRGQMLNDYPERHQSSARQRLELVARICDAAEHAHQRV